MTEVISINDNNYQAMAKAMGISDSVPSKSEKSSSLARLKILHAPIMGKEEVKGKQVNVELIEGGNYKLEIPDNGNFYAPKIETTLYLQRFMYKRFVMAHGQEKNKYVKTIMSEFDLGKIDLKDNDGGFNCGRPSGFIKDWDKAPESTKQLIRSCKRVRVVFGVVTMINPVNERGEKVSLEPTPFIWEIDNRDAFDRLGEVFKAIKSAETLPPYHTVTLNTESKSIPSGALYYVPTPVIDLSNRKEIGDEENQIFRDFAQWVKNYNEYILNKWDENKSKHEVIDTKVLDDFIEIDSSEVAV